MQTTDQSTHKLDKSYKELFEDLLHKFDTLGDEDREGNPIYLSTHCLRYLNATDTFIDALLTDGEFDDYYLHQLLFKLDALKVQITETTRLRNFPDRNICLTKINEMKFNFDSRERRPARYKTAIAA